MKKSRIFTVTLVAVMAAMATVIYVLLPEIPLIPGVDYLKLDFSDIPAILTGIAAGPLTGILVEIIKNLIHLFRTTSYGIGELMNIGVGVAMIGALSLFQKLFARLFKSQTVAAKVYFPAGICSIVCTVFAGWIFNAALTPLFFLLAGIPITPAAVWAGVTGSTLLNTVKAAFNLLPFYPIYLAVYKSYQKIG